MNKPNVIQDAVGVIRLAAMHINNPTAITGDTLQAAADECLERLRSLPEHALHLPGLFTALLHITPLGWVPYVTLTGNPERPFGAVVTDEAGNIAATATGKTVDGLATLIDAKLSRPMAGCGEASA